MSGLGRRGIEKVKEIEKDKEIEANLQEEEEKNNKLLCLIKYIPTSTSSIFQPYPSLVLPQLYLGSVQNSSSWEQISTLNIKKILNCAKEAPNLFVKKGVQYMHLPLEDSNNEDIKRYFEEATSFINSALKEGDAILVHCLAGRSRSATICAAYLMMERKMSKEEAVEFIRKCRCTALASGYNYAFDFALEELEDALQK